MRWEQWEQTGTSLTEGQVLYILYQCLPMGCVERNLPVSFSALAASLMALTPSHPPGALAQHLHPYSLTFLQVVGIKAPSRTFERKSSSADQNIVAWLVPEFVSARGGRALVFPVPLQLKALSIQQDKSTWQTERGCME